jgi:CRISPR-associated protein (TIGR03986 family)
MTNNNTTKVHAPYHFVPLSKWVYMPDWAHLVSHDVPFQDGYSGVLDYTLTNATPLCVGGKQITTKGKPSLVQWARDPNNNPVIPGSSMKGMLRSVLEIASFAKFSAIDNNHFSYRDISTASTQYATELQDTSPQAFWIKYNNDTHQWTFRKASHTVLFLDEFNKAFKKSIKDEEVSTKGGRKVTAKVSVASKYEQWPLTNDKISFEVASRKLKGTKGKDVEVSRATSFGDGELLGNPVFSGFRPGSRKFSESRLNYGYMFYGESDKCEVLNMGNQIVQKLFDTHDADLVRALKETPQPELGIPVFGRVNTKNEIIALGFAKMPRKLYPKSVHDMASANQKLMNSVVTFDMADLMFGCIREKSFSLKSRVFFTDSTCDKKIEPEVSEEVILSSPRASYLPAYMEQQGNETSRTLQQYQNGSTLKGWKKYPIRDKFTAHLPNDLKGATSVQSQMELIKPNNNFTGKIVFHNLKAEELGALIWTLQLQQEGVNSYHSLGHGKSLGAGAVTFKKINLMVQSNDGLESASLEKFTSIFMTSMNSAHPGQDEESWANSSQIKHLLSFSKEGQEHNNLSYMPLTSDKGVSFVSYSSSTKGAQKEILPPWRDGGEALSREDSVQQNKPESFGKGRLSDLVKFADEESLLSTTEIGFKSMAEQEIQQQEFSLLSPQQQSFEKLKTRFSSPEVSATKEGRQSCNGELESLLDDLLSEQVSCGFVQDFYEMCKNPEKTAYLDLAKNKKNKEKLKNRKTKLNDLAEKYELIT